MTSLPDRTALVTGAARGIGRALALRLARAGSRVLVADVDTEAAQAVVADIEAADGRALAVTMDVTRADSVAAARDRVLERAGPPDILVNNAGTVHGGGFEDVPLHRHLTTLRVNLVGTLIVTHAFWSDLLGRPEAHLVNIASASGFLGLPFGSSYAASKWGVIGLSESLRRELEVTDRGRVRVTTVCPGYTDTGLFAGVRTPRLTRMLEPDELAERITAGILDDRAFVMTPWVVRLAPLLRGLLPTRAFDRVADLFAATRSMEGWRGR